MDPTNDHHELVPRKPTLLARFKAHWNPQPVKPPEVDPDLPHFNGLQRAVEALRYGFLSLEHWMSPKGKMREFIRLNVILALLLLIPALLILPIVCFILWQVSRIVSVLLVIVINLVLIPLIVLVGLLVARFLIRLLRKH